MKASVYNLDNDFLDGWYIDTNLCDSIVAKGEQDLSVFKPNIRNYDLIELPKFDKDFNHRYNHQLFLAIEEYKKKYPWCYKELKIWGWTEPRLQRYKPGAFYQEAHCENDGNPQSIFRHLVYMTYLNDVTDGGGTEFLNQNITTSAEKGLTLIWPAGWTHYHRGVVSETQPKYILTGWCVFKP